MTERTRHDLPDLPPDLPPHLPRRPGKMRDSGATGITWLSVHEPATPATGWYAVLRLAPDCTGSLRAGAAFYGDALWGKDHDIFARSARSFADAPAAEAFAAETCLPARG